MSDNSEFGRK
ncbi:hypothetical protein A2U01_0117489, partial [Trifolium medium]|nr:hypothetical protein [Trifolium medium]